MIKNIRAKLNEKKGFTLAELLIVVAIIAVLVAIAIPIFSSQLEKSREATDLANVRAAYAEVVAEYLTEGSASPITISAKQTKANWQTYNSAAKAPIGTQIGSVGAASVPANAGGSYTVSINASTGVVTVN
ncbi:type II secretion system protein [Butyrivibrio sp. INlla16]|uniref:type II secretion system protein n=1 Tax=Butyrivibrio sp. INlla16 TaxID=1520807 RepID=UPI00088DAF69|nr:prepilin-type N-terminal cleavage/methylation domain-containing protein [Butyrivibrio sp. INlla16]SDB59861.1 prepilin-type N-terminal cleavage/methylation domain-containing protein [Butyrivibrio sp. INlla16]